MTEINYNEKSRAVEISVRLFTDDFEKTLRKNCRCKVDLIDPSMKNNLGKTVAAYISDHLKININGTPQTLEFIGYEQEQESTWNYFVIKNVSKVSRVDINNSLLHDFRDEQINMLHLKINGKEQTDKLDFPSKQYHMNF